MRVARHAAPSSISSRRASSSSRRWRTAAVNASAKHLDDLADLLADAERHLSGQDADDTVLGVANMRFHRGIADGSGNTILAEVVFTLTEVHIKEQMAVLDLYNNRRRDHEQHKLILDALQAHDAAGARRLMSEHLADVISVVRTKLKGGEQSDGVSKDYGVRLDPAADNKPSDDPVGAKGPLATIKTIYVCNHAHTDIGFTDYQELALRQHGEFVGQALDLIEATDAYPAEAQYRWTIETTGPFLKYLRQAEQGRDRPLPPLARAGPHRYRGMQYNMTPLLNIEQMHRSLYPLRALRDEFGFKVEAAMQDDVNGVSWLYRRPARRSRHQVLHRRDQPDPRRAAEAVPRRLPLGGPERQEGAGLERLSLPLRPQPGRPRQLGPGRSPAAALDRRARERRELSVRLPLLRIHPSGARRQRPAGCAHARSSSSAGTTRAARTGWSSSPSPTSAGCLRSKYANVIGTQRGDWTDHWADGVGSTAFEVGVNRAAHEIVGIGESLEAWRRSRGQAAAGTPTAPPTSTRSMTLFDEHTWGAYSSVEAPHSLFSRAQWNRKAGFAYTAAMEGHDRSPRAANALAAPLGTKGPEGIFNLGNLDPKEAFKPSGIDEVLVFNTLPWERKVIVEEPEPRGGAAPVGMLDTFFNRRSTWGGARPIPPIRRVAGTVPPMGYAFLDLTRRAGRRPQGQRRHHREPALSGDDRPQDRRHRRVLRQGAGPRFRRRVPGLGPGQYVYETVDSPDDRLAIADINFRQARVLHRPQGHAVAARDARPRSRSTRPRSTRAAPRSPSTSRRPASRRDASSMRSMPTPRRRRRLEHRQARQHRRRGGVRRLPVQARCGELHASTSTASPPCPTTTSSMAPPRTGTRCALGRRQRRQARRHARAARCAARPSRRHHHRQVGPRRSQPEGPTIMTWALNNHWLVNFKASQGGHIPLRYRLTTHDGPVEPAAAARFAAEAACRPSRCATSRRPGRGTIQLLPRRSEVAGARHGQAR